MPLPRKARPKRRLGGSRSARRRVHEKSWIQAKLVEKFAKIAAMIERKRQQAIADGDLQPAPEQSAHEKAPGLAAEGFSSCFQEKAD